MDKNSFHIISVKGLILDFMDEGVELVSDGLYLLIFLFYYLIMLMVDVVEY